MHGESERATLSGHQGWTRTTFNAVELVTDPPAAPTQTTPLPSALLEVDTTMTFRWEPEDAATQYEFQLIDSADVAFEPITAFISASSCETTPCSVSIELSIPLSEDYVWQVRASNAAGASAFSASPFSLIPAATLIPQTPDNLTPVEGLQLSEGDTVEFTWAQEPNAVNYEFHFFDNVAKTTTPFIVGLRARDICTDAICSLDVDVDLPIASDHAWRVRGQNSLGYSAWSRSDFDVIEPITEPPGAFVLLSPSLGETLIQGSDAVFSWQPALRAIRYDITITDGSDGSATPQTAQILAGSCTSDQCAYTTQMDLPVADTHNWQVKAINPLGERDSETATFAVGLEIIEPPELPALLAPESAAVFVSGSTVDFQWQADSDATLYEFYITDAINGSLPIDTNLQPADLCTASLCTHTIELNLPASDLHTWHARIFHDELASAWFTTRHHHC